MSELNILTMINIIKQPTYIPANQATAGNFYRFLEADGTTSIIMCFKPCANHEEVCPTPTHGHFVRMNESADSVILNEHDKLEPLDVCEVQFRR